MFTLRPTARRMANSSAVVMEENLTPSSGLGGERGLAGGSAGGRGEGRGEEREEEEEGVGRGLDFCRTKMTERS